MVVGRRPLLVVGRREQGASPSHYYILLLVSYAPVKRKPSQRKVGSVKVRKVGSVNIILGIL